jgi:hypothetical protein
VTHHWSKTFQNTRFFDDPKSPIDFCPHLVIFPTTSLIACFQQYRIFWLMGRTERQREIARRRKRKVGLAKVRARHAASKNEAEKALLLAKARRMSPFITLD